MQLAEAIIKRINYSSMQGNGSLIRRRRVTTTG